MKGTLRLVKAEIFYSEVASSFLELEESILSSIIVMMAIFGQLILVCANLNLQEKFSLNILLDIER